MGLSGVEKKLREAALSGDVAAARAALDAGANKNFKDEVRTSSPAASRTAQSAQSGGGRVGTSIAWGLAAHAARLPRQQ
jgi:hypothetical protein